MRQSLIQRFDGSTVPVPLIVRLFLGGYFISTGITKVQDPFAFMKGIRLYEMLPESPAFLLNGTAVVLPWLEILCGAALVLGLFRRGAGMLMALMLCVFTPAILLRALAIVQEEGISFFDVKFDCGCGTGPETTWVKLLKNTGLFLMATFMALSHYRRWSLAGLFVPAEPRPVYCDRCGKTVVVAIGDVCEACDAKAETPGPSPSAAT